MQFQIQQHFQVPGLIHVLFWIGVIGGSAGGVIGLLFLVIVIRDKYDDWRNDHPKVWT